MLAGASETGARHRARALCVVRLSAAVVRAHALHALHRPADINLIVAKTNRIEVHLVTTGDLQPVFETPVYGRVTCLEVFRPPVSVLPTECVFFCTFMLLLVLFIEFVVYWRNGVLYSHLFSAHPSLCLLQGATQDLLFFCTARYNFVILSYNSTTGTVATEAAGDIRVSCLPMACSASLILLLAILCKLGARFRSAPRPSAILASHDMIVTE